MDVLVTWLGRSDLKASGSSTEEVGPLARILQHRAGKPFDRVLVLQDFAPAEAEAYLEWLKRFAGPELKIICSTVEMPAGGRSVTDFVERTVEALREHRFDKARLWFNISSGMPYMQFAQMLVAKLVANEGRLIEADRQGAHDVPNPLKERTLFATLAAVNERAPAGSGQIGQYAYRSKSVLDLLDRIKVLKDQGNLVRNALIVAPPGTEADAVALSLANNTKTVVINCGAMTPEEVRAELVGKPGSKGDKALLRINYAPLVLHNVHRLPTELQLSLYQARSNAGPAVRQLIATTMIDPRDPEAAGCLDACFVIGLFGVTLYIPPLRDRSEDIPNVADAILAELVGPHRQLKLSPEADRMLQSYPWPFNLLELKRTLSGVAAMPKFFRPDILHQIECDDLTAVLHPLSKEEYLLHRPFDADFDLDRLTWEFKAHHYWRAMAQAGGNQAEAGRRLLLNKGKKIADFRKDMDEKLGITGTTDPLRPPRKPRVR